MIKVQTYSRLQYFVNVEHYFSSLADNTELESILPMLCLTIFCCRMYEKNLKKIKKKKEKTRNNSNGSPKPPDMSSEMDSFSQSPSSKEVENLPPDTCKVDSINMTEPSGEQSKKHDIDHETVSEDIISERFSDVIGDYSIYYCKLCAFKGYFGSLQIHLKLDHDLTLTKYLTSNGEHWMQVKVLHQCKVCKKTIHFTKEMLEEHLKTHGKKGLSVGYYSRRYLNRETYRRQFNITESMSLSEDSPVAKNSSPSPFGTPTAPTVVRPDTDNIQNAAEIEKGLEPISVLENGDYATFNDCSDPMVKGDKATPSRKRGRPRKPTTPPTNLHDSACFKTNGNGKISRKIIPLSKDCQKIFDGKDGETDFSPKKKKGRPKKSNLPMSQSEEQGLSQPKASEKECSSKKDASKRYEDTVNKPEVLSDIVEIITEASKQQDQLEYDSNSKEQQSVCTPSRKRGRQKKSVSPAIVTAERSPQEISVQNIFTDNEIPAKITNKKKCRQRKSVILANVSTSLDWDSKEDKSELPDRPAKEALAIQEMSQNSFEESVKNTAIQHKLKCLLDSNPKENSTGPDELEVSQQSRDARREQECPSQNKENAVKSPKKKRGRPKSLESTKDATSKQQTELPESKEKEMNVSLHGHGDCEKAEKGFKGTKVRGICDGNLPESPASPSQAVTEDVTMETQDKFDNESSLLITMADTLDQQLSMSEEAGGKQNVLFKKIQSQRKNQARKKKDKKILNGFCYNSSRKQHIRQDNFDLEKGEGGIQKTAIDGVVNMKNEFVVGQCTEIPSEEVNDPKNAEESPCQSPESNQGKFEIQKYLEDTFGKESWRLSVNENDVCVFECRQCKFFGPYVAFRSHILHSHNLSLKNYKRKHGELNLRVKVQHICKVCGHSLVYIRETLNEHLLSHDLSGKDYFFKYFETKGGGKGRKNLRSARHHKDYAIFECHICSYAHEFKQFEAHLGKAHGLSSHSYLEKYKAFNYCDKVLHQCKICWTEIVHYSKGLKRHLKEHKLNAKEYVLKYFSDNEDDLADDRLFDYESASDLDFDNETTFADTAHDNERKDKSKVSEMKDCRVLRLEQSSDGLRQAEPFESRALVDDPDISSSHQSSQPVKDLNLKEETDSETLVELTHVTVDQCPCKYTGELEIAKVRFSDTFGDFTTYKCGLCEMISDYGKMRNHISTNHKLKLTAYKKMHGNLEVAEFVKHECKICRKVLDFSANQLYPHVKSHQIDMNSYRTRYLASLVQEQKKSEESDGEQIKDKERDKDITDRSESCDGDDGKTKDEAHDSVLGNAKITGTETL